VQGAAIKYPMKINYVKTGHLGQEKKVSTRFRSYFESLKKGLYKGSIDRGFG